MGLLGLRGMGAARQRQTFPRAATWKPLLDLFGPVVTDTSSELPGTWRVPQRYRDNHS